MKQYIVQLHVTVPQDDVGSLESWDWDGLVNPLNPYDDLTSVTLLSVVKLDAELLNPAKEKEDEPVELPAFTHTTNPCKVGEMAYKGQTYDALVDPHHSCNGCALEGASVICPPCSVAESPFGVSVIYVKQED